MRRVGRRWRPSRRCATSTSARAQLLHRFVSDAEQVRTTITTEAGAVHVTTAGLADGPVVVLSSGLGGAWFDWTATVALLAAGARVIVFDRPGTGDSAP